MQVLQADLLQTQQYKGDKGAPFNSNRGKFNTDDDPTMSTLMAVLETLYDPSWYLVSGATNHIIRLDKYAQ